MRAVIIVHIGGYCTPQLRQLVQLCESANVPVVEDCAHAHGSMLESTPAGRWGTAGAFSFFPTKPLTTGEGGMLVTENGTVAELARRYRNQGKNAHGNHVLPGNSWRLPEISAAIGLAQLNDSEYDRQVRGSHAAAYDNALHGTPYQHITSNTLQRPSYHKYIVLSPTEHARDQALEHLRENNVQSAGLVYKDPLSMLPVFSDLNIRSFPVAVEFSQTHFCPPLWTRMPTEQATRVAAVLKTLR